MKSINQKSKVKSDLKSVTNKVNSLLVTPRAYVKDQRVKNPLIAPKNGGTMNNSNKLNSKSINSKNIPQPSDFRQTVGGIVDVAEEVISSIEGNPISIAKIPNTILKAVETGKSLYNDVSGLLSPQKIKVDPGQVISEQNEKIVKEISKSMPVINTQGIPSSFVSQLTLPNITVKSTMEKGQKITNVTGCNAFVQFHHAITTNWTHALAWPLEPITGGSIFGSRVIKIASLFQRWRLNSFSIQYIPTQPLSDPGGVAVVVNNSTNLGSVQLGMIPDVSTFSQYQHKLLCSSGSKGDLSIKMKNPWLFCSPQAGDSVKWYYQWVMGLFVYGNGDGLACGTLVCTFDIDFCQEVPQSTYFLDHYMKYIMGSWIRYSPVELSFSVWLKHLYRRLLAEEFSWMLLHEKKKVIWGELGEKEFQLIFIDVTDQKSKYYNENKKRMINSEEYSKTIIPKVTISNIIEMLYRHYGSFFIMMFSDNETPTIAAILLRIVGSVIKLHALKEECMDIKLSELGLESDSDDESSVTDRDSL